MRKTTKFQNTFRAIMHSQTIGKRSIIGVTALALGVVASSGVMIPKQHSSSLHFMDVGKAREHLSEVMDRYHKTTVVYTEQDAGGNIYFSTGWMGDTNALRYTGECLNNPRSGLTCIRIDFTANNNWAGIYWQYPENNWGTEPGYDLRGATKLTFWARGEKGGEQVRFFMAGITGSHRDPPQKTTAWINLNSSWTMYSIDVGGINLQSIIGGFGFVTEAARNPQNITFYLDDIQYDKQRLEKPRFLLSYDPSRFLGDYPEDSASRNAAYINDNALTMMTFMRDTTNLQSEDWGRAKLIGDAFITCQDSDRYFHDGRLRNGYMTGDLTYRGTARLPSWWDYQQQRLFENEYAVSSYTGNMAWVMIAWLWNDKYNVNPSYRNAALRLGEWIYNNTYDTRGAGGYMRGFWGPEPQNKFLSKSTEDNILVYSAFSMLYKATNDPQWRERSLYARDFVIAMWDSADGHFWPGTVNDGVTLLKDVIPLNIHTLAFMAFHLSDPVLRDRYTRGIDWVYDNLRVDNCPRGDNFKGFDCNSDRDGVWFEGTAQMAVVYRLLNNTARADNLLEQLRAAQASARNGNGKGIVEACHDSVTTGFYDSHNNPVYKNNRLHIGTTAWYVLAEPRLAPNMEFIFVPTYGSSENLKGQIRNANPNDYKVAVYIFVEGAGWWTKPSPNQPLTPIQNDSTWICDITTGGSDIYATRIHAFLLPNGINPPIASGLACLPTSLDMISIANVKMERDRRTISFSGYEWWVKASVEPVGPGSNYFSDSMENVWIDEQGQLHLKITQRNGTWYCAEVILKQSLGYGRYIFKTASRTGQINEKAVLGLFTWDNDGCNVFHREIDIEFSRWGVATDPNAQYVVQPWNQPGNRNRWTIPPSQELSTHSFTWKPDSISFLSAKGHHSIARPDSILYTWHYTGANIPKPDKENLRINLWLFNGPPSDNTEVEVVITNFEYDDLTTSINEKDEMQPTRYSLSQNYPNPFNPETRIRYELPSTEKVKIAVYNVNGQLVRILFDGLQSTGRHVVRWDGKTENGYQVASGIYLVRMEAGEFKMVKKMVLTR